MNKLRMEKRFGDIHALSLLQHFMLEDFADRQSRGRLLGMDLGKVLKKIRQENPILVVIEAREKSLDAMIMQIYGIRAVTVIEEIIERVQSGETFTRDLVLDISVRCWGEPLWLPPGA